MPQIGSMNAARALLAVCPSEEIDFLGTPVKFTPINTDALELNPPFLLTGERLSPEIWRDRFGSTAILITPPMSAELKRPVHGVTKKATAVTIEGFVIVQRCKSPLAVAAVSAKERVLVPLVPDYLRFTGAKAAAA